MTGYQEILIDPSYRGQIVAMTYPLIGNYGINSVDQESRSPHVRGFVIEELSEAPSNWRSEMSLDEYLRKWDIPGVQGIDTRALTRHLRTRGAMKACLTTEKMSIQQAVQRAVEGEGVIGMDYVREVSTPEIYRWDPDDKLSQPWSIANGNGDSKPKFGHRGANQPVKDLHSGKVAITAQNHGFAVDPESLPKNVEVSHINLNDNTVEGMRHKELPIFSVQYHPEAAPGPHDASYFFSQFADLIEGKKSRK